MIDTVKIRRPEISDSDNPSGRVARDERGNAIWKWAGRESELPVNVDMPALALADEPLALHGNAKINKLAAKSGYDPYESGLIERSSRPKRRDLRQLSRWIEQQKQLGQDDDEG